MCSTPDSVGTLSASATEILEALPDAIVIADADGRILFVNAQLERLSGYERAEVIGTPVETIVPEVQRGMHEQRRREFVLHPRTGMMDPTVEAFLRCKDGRSLPVDVGFGSVSTGDGLLVVASIRDASGRRRIESTVRENERRWRSLLENVRLIVVGLGPTGDVAYVNPFLLQLTGYRREEVLGKGWFENFLPESQWADLTKAFKELIDRGLHTYLETPIVTKTGEQRLVAWYNTVLRDPDGRVSGTLSIGEDITDRKHSQDRLEAVNEVTHAILEGKDADEVLRLIARRARQIVGADLATVATPSDDNPDALVLRVAEGAKADELVGMTFPLEKSVSGDVMRTRRPAILEDASTDHRVHQPVVSIGGLGPALFVPLAASGRVFGTLGVANLRGEPSFSDQDLAHLRLFAAQAAIALEDARVQEQIHRLAVLEDRERIGRELHDGVIQSLFAIGIHLEATAGLIGDEQARGRVEESVGHLDRVIADIRNYIFKLRPGLLADRQLDPALRHLAADFQERTEVTTIVEIDPGACTRLAPVANDVIQFATEALSNVGRHAQAATCRISLQRSNGSTIVEVDDDGRGFDVTRALGGQGLGNLRERASALGGTFEIESTPSKGTTLRLTLPL